jgi:hypothetical protein
MITVQNLTKQSMEVIFHDSQEYIHYWLKGRTSVSVPKEFITETTRNLASRKILKISKLITK